MDLTWSPADNMVSTHIFSGCPGVAAPAAAKAGVANLTQTLAVEWAAHGIRLDAIAPAVFPNPTVQQQIRPEEQIDSAFERAARTASTSMPRAARSRQTAAPSSPVAPITNAHKSLL
jgi:NAD(P)-dependent dehydrogenase (short-subunit alcohol dehydrogenase family)